MTLRPWVTEHLFGALYPRNSTYDAGMPRAFAEELGKIMRDHAEGTDAKLRKVRSSLSVSI